MADHCPRALSCQSLAPVIGRKSPSDLNTRSERSVECRDSKPNESDKGVVPAKLDRTQAKAVMPEVGLDPVY